MLLVNNKFIWYLTKANPHSPSQETILQVLSGVAATWLRLYSLIRSCFEKKRPNLIDLVHDIKTLSMHCAFLRIISLSRTIVVN
jgi:hypothetical protein